MVRCARCGRGDTSDRHPTNGRRTPPLTPMHALCSSSTVSLCVVVCLMTRQLVFPNVSLDWRRTSEVLGSDYAAYAPHLADGCEKKEFPTSLSFLRAVMRFSDYSAPTAKVRAKKWLMEPFPATGKNELRNLEFITDAFARISIGDRIVRPLLASAPPRPNLWSPMTSAGNAAVEQFDFVDMLWWHELDTEKSYNIAGCSASDELHLLIHDEKAKREHYLATCAQLVESNEENMRQLKMHYEGDAVLEACGARECKSCEAPVTGRFNCSLNSTFDAQEGPVLHDVSLAEAASFNTTNATESAIGQMFASRPIEAVGCDAMSPMSWESCEQDCGILDTDYTSTSIVELLDDAEPNLCFSADESSPGRRLSSVTADANTSWGASQRRPVCLSPQFRLPSNECPANAVSSKKNLSNLCHSQLSESFDGEDWSGLEMGSSSGTSPRFCRCRSPAFHENDEDECWTMSARTSRSGGLVEERQSQGQDVRGPGRRSRDEELARQYALPASAAQISSMPLIELNRLMHTARLSEVQQTIVRKIRRRGKNKLAARSCRKRKNDKRVMLSR